MLYNYCPLCGKKLKNVYSFDEGNVPYCKNDNIFFFNTPKPCVIVAVMKDDMILLLKQSYIFKNSKVLVSGYVTSGETVEETVYREVLEETGITISNIKYLGSEYFSEKDILMLTYISKYKSGDIIRSSEVEYAGWIHINEAIKNMKEDEIGKRVVRKVINLLNEGY